MIGTQVDTESGAAAILNPHSFALRYMALNAGAKTEMQARDGVEVLMVHRGRIIWRNDVNAFTELGAGDTFTVPRTMARQIEAITDAEIFIVLGSETESSQ